MKVDEFERKINYKFKNKSLVNLALTHSSFKNKKNKNYERLEFLGDRVLSLVISEHLFLKYPNENEGALSKRLSNLVSKQTLLEVANEIGVKEMLKIDISVSEIISKLDCLPTKFPIVTSLSSALLKAVISE